MSEGEQNIVNDLKVANPTDKQVEKATTQPQALTQQQDNNTKQPVVNQQAIDNSKYQGEIDCLKAQMEEQRQRNDKLQKDYERLLEEQNKNIVINKIKQSGVQPKEEYVKMTANEIMTSFVKEYSKVNIEGKGKNYIEGVFEAICNKKNEDFNNTEPYTGLAGTIRVVEAKKPTPTRFSILGKEDEKK